MGMVSYFWWNEDVVWKGASCFYRWDLEQCLLPIISSDVAILCLVQRSCLWTKCKTWYPFFVFYFLFLVIGRHIVPINTHQKPSKPEKCLRSKWKINGNNIGTCIGVMTGTVFVHMDFVDYITLSCIPCFIVLNLSQDNVFSDQTSSLVNIILVVLLLLG